ncbi:GFA family protein [Frigidibacter sp. MR17.14]|uniref:GFA family protein n=1 Tax=Frigidibacter sp. MR17.14 TaxID=3126509 RepID=UPI003012D8C4
MTEDRPWREAACHCGAVQFRVKLARGFETIRRCTCSLCRMRGAIAVSVAPEEFEILSGADRLSLYQFNTGVAEHWFCRDCGIYTHHRRRSDPTQFGVNVACLKGVSPFDFAEVQVTDGVAHPSDTGGGSRLAGVLRYEAF